MDSKELCKICSNNLSKYKCPKCMINYCSIDCYKNEIHSNCSENFYKSCFMEGLKEQTMDPASKRKFGDMLKKVKEQLDEDDDGHDEDFVNPSFLDALDDKYKEMWDMLDKKEKREFCEIAEKGDFSSLIEHWDPWWMPKKTALVEDVTTTKKTEKTVSSKGLEEPKNSGKFSDKICFTAVNVIYGYAYTMRLFNGGSPDLALDMARCIQSVSSSLGEAVFLDSSQAIAHCIMSFQKDQAAEEFFVSNEFSMAVIQDVAHIVNKPVGGSGATSACHVETCLTDCLSIFKKVVKMLHRDKGREGSKLETHAKEEWRKTFFKSKKKLEFLIDWSKVNGHSLSALGPLLEDEFHSKMSLLCEMKNDENLIKEVLSKNRTGLSTQPKIVEL